MSSSEPRLISGEGPVGPPAHALPEPAPPPLDRGSNGSAYPGGEVPSGLGSQVTLPATFPPRVPASRTAESSGAEPTPLPNSGVGNGFAAKQSASIDYDSLPPLVSLSELILEAPAWLFSAALHMLVVIVLGLLFIVPERPLELLLRLDDSDGFEELSGSEFDLELDMAEEALDAAEQPQELVALEEPVLVDPTDIRPPEFESDSILVATPIQMALTGRSQGMQQRLVDAFGGTAATQRAVMMALRWLQRYQSKQGMWSLSGKYKGGARSENREAATGLALLAFQGAGYTPKGDPQHDFTKLTSRAWKSLLRKQDESGSFFQGGRHNGQLYTQAICTIALCELYGMTQDSSYREPAQRAIDYCIRVQSAEGGWRYFPGSGSDMSVTGWFVMALQSARMAKLEVPVPALKRISGFLDSVSQSGGSSYAYLPTDEATFSMTAEGLLCRQYLGWSQTDPRLRRGANSLIKELPTWESGERDVYYWYYATQVCHHMEGKHWRSWNDVMKVVLPDHQVQTGPERGSWDPKGDQWGDEGGRLFVTCLSTFMLEVYYRHLPIYQANNLGGGF